MPHFRKTPRRAAAMGLASVVFAATLLAACQSRDTAFYTEKRAVCANRNPLRNLYFGDLHVHTSYSFDAYAADVRTSPEEAYRFARGEAINLEAGRRGPVSVRLDRPLDFAAVTDHAEFFGEVQACADPRSAAYATADCVTYRKATLASTTIFGIRLSNPSNGRFGFCVDDADCAAKARSAWLRTQRAAEDAYDRSAACRFTSFIGYEYSAAPTASNLHRNVIFRNTRVPEAPISFFEAPTPVQLWRALDAQCLSAGTGCDALSIPHNANLSNGRMFKTESTENGGRADAALRARLERVVEIFQHKGDSECMNGLAGALGGQDELCDFEKPYFPPIEDCRDGTGAGGLAGFGCVSARDFVRNALVHGLLEAIAWGINPLKLGIIASTDTHNGTPGAVAEHAFEGHVGKHDATRAQRVDGPTFPPGDLLFNPGGLAGVWAVENSRDALFEALSRRETFGTSGPRIAVRLFGKAQSPAATGGAQWGNAFCRDPRLVERGYAEGVPMGGDLVVPAGTAPTFVVSALGDPGGDGRGPIPLHRIQLIKGWVDASGTPQAKVFDVARNDGDNWQVDPQTCATRGTGAMSLCGTWTDPEHRAGEPALYYARVVELPSCRWSLDECARAPGDARPARCGPDGPARSLVRERAWTSPIWTSAR